MPTGRRVAITGLGLVTPLGNSVEETWCALLKGQSGIAPITNFDAGGLPVRIAAEVKDFNYAPDRPHRKLLKYAARHARFALAAAAQAMDDARQSPRLDNAARWGCVAGSGMMAIGFAELLQFQRRFAADGRLAARLLFEPAAPSPDPIAYARNQPNTGLALVVERFGIRGYANTVHTACASGGQAIGMGLRLIRRGSADFVLAGGFDSMINPIGVAAFTMLGALSTDNDPPALASRPFDRTRNGFVLGEGAGFMVLEEWQSARRRGARIYAELAGDGNSLSSYRITDSHPSGDGPIQAMRAALKDAGAQADQVGYINAHGTSTIMNDRSECAAVNAVFGPHTQRLKVSSTKSLMGHLIAGAGAVEAVICALAIHNSMLPFNANLEHPDPQCDLNFVRERPLQCRLELAMSNSFGFGGSNSSLVFRNPEDVRQ
jgi:3-oxoacyl-[acyl-carrier-protein] synthase II